MRRPLIFSLFILILVACEGDGNKLTNLLLKVDEVRLVHITANDTLSHNITDKRGIEIFTEIVDGKNYNIQQTSKNGEIVYLSKGKIIFKVDIINDGIKYVFNNKVYREKISYRAGMYISEVQYTNTKR